MPKPLYSITISPFVCLVLMSLLSFTLSLGACSSSEDVPAPLSRSEIIALVEPFAGKMRYSEDRKELLLQREKALENYPLSDPYSLKRTLDRFSVSLALSLINAGTADPQPRLPDNAWMPLITPLQKELEYISPQVPEGSFDDALQYCADAVMAYPEDPRALAAFSFLWGADTFIWKERLDWRTKGAVQAETFAMATKMMAQAVSEAPNDFIVLTLKGHLDFFISNGSNFKDQIIAYTKAACYGNDLFETWVVWDRTIHPHGYYGTLPEESAWIQRQVDPFRNQCPAFAGYATARLMANMVKREEAAKVMPLYENVLASPARPYNADILVYSAIARISFSHNIYSPILVQIWTSDFNNCYAFITKAAALEAERRPPVKILDQNLYRSALITKLRIEEVSFPPDLLPTIEKEYFDQHGTNKNRVDFVMETFVSPLRERAKERDASLKYPENSRLLVDEALKILSDLERHTPSNELHYARAILLLSYANTGQPMQEKTAAIKECFNRMGEIAPLRDISAYDAYDLRLRIILEWITVTEPDEWSPALNQAYTYLSYINYTPPKSALTCLEWQKRLQRILDTCELDEPQKEALGKCIALAEELAWATPAARAKRISEKPW